MKTTVLFLCVHNAGRSQIAEAYLKKFAGNRFHVESAGLEPGILNPLVVQVMQEDGIDISGNQTKDVFALLKEGKSFQYVITVCDAAASERCPVFPGKSKKINWAFDDPASFTGTPREKLDKTKALRDKIKKAVNEFAMSMAAG